MFGVPQTNVKTKTSPLFFQNQDFKNCMDHHHPPLSQPVDPPPEPTRDTMATEIPPESSNSGGVMKNKTKKKKKKNKACVNDPFDPHASSAASYSSSSCSTTWFSQRGIRVSASRRNPRVVIGAGRQKSDENVEALALPLGMSIAAVLAQVPFFSFSFFGIVKCSSFLLMSVVLASILVISIYI